MGEIIAWVVIVALVVWCIRSLVKSRKEGGSCAGCSSCDGGCSHCSQNCASQNTKGDKLKNMMTVTVHVDGMMCGMCEAHVADAIRKALPQAKKVKAKHKKNMATFCIDETFEESAVKHAIDQIGYEYKGMSVE
ncbi:MAG: FeoB-associated Cys-rich membrane protein [Eubacterium sp.]|nr:FeoB-associated Cys-rich membrane protein [Eubacterium sp.]